MAKPLSTREVADRLGISKDAAQKALSRGGYEPIHVEWSTNYYSFEDIKELEQARKKRAKTRVSKKAKQ